MCGGEIVDEKWKLSMERALSGTVGTCRYVPVCMRHAYAAGTRHASCMSCVSCGMAPPARSTVPLSPVQLQQPALALKLLLVAAGIAGLAPGSTALDNGLGLSGPAMGWSSWSVQLSLLYTDFAIQPPVACWAHYSCHAQEPLRQQWLALPLPAGCQWAHGDC